MWVDLALVHWLETQGARMGKCHLLRRGATRLLPCSDPCGSASYQDWTGVLVHVELSCNLGKKK